MRESLNSMLAAGWKRRYDFVGPTTWPSSMIILLEKGGAFVRSDYHTVREDDSDVPPADQVQTWTPCKIEEQITRHVVTIKKDAL